MNEQRRARPVPPEILASLDESQADLNAGRIEDFGEFLERMRQPIEQRTREIEQQRSSKRHG